MYVVGKKNRAQSRVLAGNKQLCISAQFVANNCQVWSRCLNLKFLGECVLIIPNLAAVIPEDISRKEPSLVAV